MPDALLLRFWQRMDARYPAPTTGWAARLGPTPDGVAGAEWRHTLRGLSGAQIKRGIDADEKRGSDFPPSGPVFLRMALGIPALRDAIASYQAGIVTPFTRLMRDHTDSWLLDRADYPQAERILTAAFVAAVADVDRGGALPVSAEADALPAPTPAFPEQATPVLRRMSEREYAAIMAAALARGEQRAC